MAMQVHLVDSHAGAVTLQTERLEFSVGLTLGENSGIGGKGGGKEREGRGVGGTTHRPGSQAETRVTIWKEKGINNTRLR